MALPFTGGSASAGQVAGWGCLLSAGTNSAGSVQLQAWSSLHALQRSTGEKRAKGWEWGGFSCSGDVLCKN